MAKRVVCYFLYLAFLSLPDSAVAEDIVKTIISESSLDQRSAFKHEVIKAALDATINSHGPYALNNTNKHMNAARAIAQLQTGENLNTYIALTTTKWEQNAIPIRIPIRRGISSYRLLLIHKDSLEEFESVRTPEQLSQLRAGLNPGWATYSLLDSLSWNIVNVDSYNNMFDMLEVKRFDYLLRAVNEIYDELAVRPDKNELVIEPNIVVNIPSATYFFVSKKTPRIAQRIELGLEKLVESGKLEQIFNRYFSEDLQKARIDNRRVIYINNHQLPKLTPLQRDELWMPLTAAKN